jgi:hypothetical protein
MRTIHKTMLATIGTVALAASFSLPASAATDHYIQNDSSGEDIWYANGTLALSGQHDTLFYVGHTDGVYYQYVDAEDTSLCLQANTADTVMTVGGCDAGSTRQFWWYDNSKLLINQAFGTDAWADGSQVGLISGACSSAPAVCDWRVGDAS